MNKADLISKLNSLEGITNDERAYLINLVNTKKKYGLVWEEKPEDVEELLRENLPILREVVEKRILSIDLPTPEKKEGTLFDGEETDELPTPPNHILIEGDNLHALTALTFTHEGVVDIIYIDPPYNTGKKDFKYNDHFVDKDDEFRHSKWISFMSKRLKIAKKLLKDNGVIFISIDENEIHNLRLLADEIFTENNFVEQIVWNKRIPKNDKGIGNIHEYILLYAKRYSSEHIFMQKKEGIDEVNELVESIKKKKVPIPEAEKEVKQFFKKNGYDRGITLYNSFNDEYRLWGKINVSWPNAKTFGPRYNIFHPKTNKPCKVPDRGWRWTEDTFNTLVDYVNVVELHDGTFMCGRIWFAKDENTQPSSIKFLDEVNDFLLRSIISTKSDGSDELSNIIGEGKFDYPKPTDLIQLLINSISSSNSLILDFFAGSGTTLHAVMQLNSEDNGQRRCVMVTNNENNICEEVTYVRNQKVIQGYTNSKGETIPGLTNNNLRYYKCDFVPREPSLKSKRQLTKSATDLLSTKENCYTDCTAEFLSGNQSWIKLFTDDLTQFLCIIYDDEKIEEAVIILKELINNKQPEKSVKVYVFSNGQYPYTEEFEDILQHITLCALPDAIYKAYQNVLPSKKGLRLLEFEDISGESASQTAQVFVENDLFNQEG